MASRKQKRPEPEGFQPIEVEVRPDERFRPIEVERTAAPVADNTKKPATGKED